jgi:Family of unknown function (DUF5677)
MAKGTKRTPTQTRYSPLESHRREGKIFTPPLMQNPKMQLMSWRDMRVPEILWAILLAGNLERQHYLDIFRSVIQRATAAMQPQVHSLSHSFLSGSDPEGFDHVFEPVFDDEQASGALSSLLLLKQLPDRSHWKRHTSQPDPQAGWSVLAKAISLTTDHQSQQSTDCRWLRGLYEVRRGRMVLNNPEREQEFSDYPNCGDMRKVRPFIRSVEGAIDQMFCRDNPPQQWPTVFWDECWKNTVCTPARRRDEQTIDTTQATKELADLYREIIHYFPQTVKTTHIDPRHDTVFGLVMYGISLAYSTCIDNAHHRAEGRIAIRSMAECYIVLAYLLKKDEPGLWEKYRNYGNGQTKLAYLKSFDLNNHDLPSYVTSAELESMANEDVWLEFVSVDVGNWADTDLRKMSEQTNTKPIYDKYFVWPSGYVHGNWGAVRDTIFGICLNPLHRFHRVPISPRVTMESVAPAAIKLTNLLIQSLNCAYPTFKFRLSKLTSEIRDEA